MLINNSIRMNLSKYSMENEIRLLLSVPQNKSKTIVIFEGQDDIKLFMPLLNLNSVYLFESYGGKPAIKSILQVRFLNEKRVVGIADKDYEMQKVERLFFCDYCNAEMMIVGNDDSLAYTLFTVTNEWLDVSSVRDRVLQKLIFLTIIRKLNDENDWGLTFQNISINGIMQKSDLTPLMQAVRVINSKNRLNIIDEQRKGKIKSEKEHLLSENLLEYTNGHDFCKALLREIKFLFPSSKKIASISSDEFEDFLRMGYRKEFFAYSSLYNSLYKYQTQNHLVIV